MQSLHKSVYNHDTSTQMVCDPSLKSCASPCIHRWGCSQFATFQLTLLAQGDASTPWSKVSGKPKPCTHQRWQLDIPRPRALRGLQEDEIKQGDVLSTKNICHISVRFHLWKGYPKKNATSRKSLFGVQNVALRRWVWSVWQCVWRFVCVHATY